MLCKQPRGGVGVCQMVMFVDMGEGVLTKRLLTWGGLSKNLISFDLKVGYV